MRKSHAVSEALTLDRGFVFHDQLTLSSIVYRWWLLGSGVDANIFEDSCDTRKWHEGRLAELWLSAPPRGQKWGTLDFFEGSPTPLTIGF